MRRDRPRRPGRARRVSWSGPHHPTGNLVPRRASRQPRPSRWPSRERGRGPIRPGGQQEPGPGRWSRESDRHRPRGTRRPEHSHPKQCRPGRWCPERRRLPERSCPERWRPGSRCPARRCPARRCPARRCPARRCPARRCPARRCPARRCPARRCPARRCWCGGGGLG
ncbi:Cys-every-fifth RiPP peptide CefA [Kribbella sp. NBC_01510]|uniref:Cys-every-fifth RiPP peptide CefA n=1 Tax=Kribbella sp. NBC_01510 TaxID=2903581 RepID=UPI00386B3191